MTHTLYSDAAHSMSSGDTHCLMIMNTFSSDIAHNMSIDDTHTPPSDDAVCPVMLHAIKSSDDTVQR